MDIAQATANVERNVMLFGIAALPVGSSCGQASRVGRERLVCTLDEAPLFDSLLVSHTAIFLNAG
jgi:hypothetical protein